MINIKLKNYYSYFRTCSGGPLVCDGTLVGVTSNGRGCAIENYPGIYIDVNYYRNWIAENSSTSMRISSLGLLITFAVVVNSILKTKSFT